MDFKNIKNKYKPQPLWLWNSKLNIDATVNSVKNMLDSSLGGFIISPHCGLNSTYLSDEWLRNVSAALNCAADTCVQWWFCNETSGYSGSSCADVSSMGLEYHQKFLRYESGEKTNERTIIFHLGYHFFYDENPVCIDPFNDNASQIYLNESFSPYVGENGNICGFVFDVSPFFTENIPWSFSFPEKYKNEYGEELLDVLIELFKPVGTYTDTRFKFWTLIFKLLCNNFLLPIYNWCTENGLKLSVKVPENNLYDPICKAAFMKICSYAHIPCFEVSSLKNISPVKALLASSLSHQMGKEQTCAMLYSSCGHSRSFDELKHMAQANIVRGVDKIVPCSVAYSLDGFRKYTVSTPMTFQKYRNVENAIFNSVIGRTCNILGEGKVRFDTLLIHNLASSLSTFEADDKNYTDENLIKLEKAIDILEKKHIPFHLGDEMILRDFARVEGNSIIIGQQKYQTIVLTETPVLLESTTALLAEFERSGGFIVMAKSLKNNPICDNENLLYTKRQYSGFNIHYFVNNSEESFTAAITSGSKLIDASTGEILPFFGIYKFSPYESILVLDDGTAQPQRPYLKPLKSLDISGTWQVDSYTPNYFLIDKCNLYINGELQYENMSAQNTTDVISVLSEPSEIECVYKFDVLSEISELYLSYENYDTFTLKLNGTVIKNEIIKQTDSDLFAKINISEYIIKGTNILSLSAKHSLNNKFRALYEKASLYNSELNRITYPKEFPPLYLSGNFSVICDGTFRKLDKKACRYLGGFKLDKTVIESSVSNLEKNGFPFFAGQITLKKTFNLSDTSYCIKLMPKGIRSISVYVNGKPVDTMLYSPFECDISNHLVKGDNIIQLTLTTNLRNLFGPHHLPLGELYEVSTKDYYGAPCIWNGYKNSPWEENYCFIEFGIDSAE